MSHVFLCVMLTEFVINSCSVFVVLGLVSLTES